jgi:hypothetical protein
MNYTVELSGEEMELVREALLDYHNEAAHLGASPAILKGMSTTYQKFTHGEDE